MVLKRYQGTGIVENLWHNIPGSNSYQISVDGRVRRTYKNGKSRILQAYPVKNKWLAVKVNINGVCSQYYVHKLMALTFNLSSNPNDVLHFKNGDIHDPALHNLEYISRSDLGKKTGAKSRRRAVVKLNSTGEITKIYASAREAGRQNFMSYQTIIDRCNGKVKSKLAPDGNCYMWDSKYNYDIPY